MIEDEFAVWRIESYGLRSGGSSDLREQRCSRCRRIPRRSSRLMPWTLVELNVVLGASGTSFRLPKSGGLLRGRSRCRSLRQVSVPVRNRSCLIPVSAPCARVADAGTMMWSGTQTPSGKKAGRSAGRSDGPLPAVTSAGRGRNRAARGRRDQPQRVLASRSAMRDRPPEAERQRWGETELSSPVHRGLPGAEKKPQRGQRLSRTSPASAPL